MYLYKYYKIKLFRSAVYLFMHIRNSYFLMISDYFMIIRNWSQLSVSYYTYVLGLRRHVRLLNHAGTFILKQNLVSKILNRYQNHIHTHLFKRFTDKPDFFLMVQFQPWFSAQQVSAFKFELLIGTIRQYYIMYRFKYCLFAIQNHHKTLCWSNGSTQ